MTGPYLDYSSLRVDHIFNWDDHKKRSVETQNRLLVDPRTQEIGQREGWIIYAVNDLQIMKYIDPDFTSGGNGARYLYIPLDEIWVSDKYIDDPELMSQVINHEISEFRFMQSGLTYDKAHEFANQKWLKQIGSPLVNL